MDDHDRIGVVAMQLVKGEILHKDPQVQMATVDAHLWLSHIGHPCNFGNRHVWPDSMDLELLERAALFGVAGAVDPRTGALDRSRLA